LVATTAVTDLTLTALSPWLLLSSTITHLWCGTDRRILYTLYTPEVEAWERSWDCSVAHGPTRRLWRRGSALGTVPSLTGRHVACFARASREGRQRGGTPDAGPAFSGTAFRGRCGSFALTWVLHEATSCCSYVSDPLVPAKVVCLNSAN